MPYVSDKDLETAISTQTATPENLLYQNQFNYWIGKFEAVYGDLVVFWNTMDNRSEMERLTFINNSIKQLITAEMPKPIITNE